MCTHKAQKYDFCTHQAHFSLILAIWEPPMALIAKMVEKSIKICQIFFSRKYIIKRVRKRSFIKNVPKLAILTLSLQDMKKSCQWGDCHRILEFDIFVRYDSMNLSDYRHFSRFWRICGYNGVVVGIMTRQ